MAISMMWRRIISVNRGQHGNINDVMKELICK